MDMKRILQAMDGISTKPVEGADSMAKFLRVVKESELNQPAQQDPNFVKYSELMAKYDLLQKEMTPDNSGVEKGWSPEFEKEVNSLKAQADQLAGPNAQAWEQSRQTSNSASMAQATANQPALAQQLEAIGDPANVADQVNSYIRYSSGLYAKSLNNITIKQGLVLPITFTPVPPSGDSSKIIQANISAANARLPRELQLPPDQLSAIVGGADQAYSGPVAEEAGMSRLLSIMNEGANPHKVALPVQMAMQHYQKPKSPVERKARIIDKYFTEAEAVITQRKEEKRALINQYASVIAERVLMKESAQPIEELSTELLGKYKKAAYADAKKADAEGDYARGDKRFKGINKATNKQFDNDLKKHGQEVSEGADLGGYNTAYLEKIASGAPGKWPCTPAEAKAELQKRIGSEDPHNPAPSSNFQKSQPKPVDRKLKEDEDLQRLIKLRDQIDEAIKQRLDPKCWKGKHKEGTKIKGGVRVNNCVPNKK